MTVGRPERRFARRTLGRNRAEQLADAGPVVLGRRLAKKRKKWKSRAIDARQSSPIWLGRALAHRDERAAGQFGVQHFDAHNQLPQGVRAMPLLGSRAAPSRCKPRARRVACSSQRMPTKLTKKPTGRTRQRAAARPAARRSAACRRRTVATFPRPK